MASLRGAQPLFDTSFATGSNPGGPNVTNSGGANDTSAPGYVGPGPYVAVFVHNGGATAGTFKVQAFGAVNPAAGLNDLAADTIWYDYQKTPGTTVSITVAAGANTCVGLAPFEPELLRLVRTDSTGTLTGVKAFLTSNGPN